MAKGSLIDLEGRVEMLVHFIRSQALASVAITELNFTTVSIKLYTETPHNLYL
jgi:hypothetical protein